MADALLRVAFAGPHVSYQDGGRRGWMRYGVAASGAMDRKALALANAALGNPPGSTAIEVSLGGLTLDCLSGTVTLALAGGGFIRQVGETRDGSWGVFPLRAGERLTIRRGPWGSWTCLAVAGRLEVPEWLGSHATHAPSGLGGGRLRSGDEVRITGTTLREDLHGPRICPVWARPRPVLHAVPGPQDRFFDPPVLDRLFHRTFHLSAAFDRMGIRLDGPALPPREALSIPSEPIVRGSVQVSGDGVATILMADHQTTGGYPKIATVLDDDLDAFAQCRPGQPIAFRPVTAAEAVELARFRARQHGLAPG